MKKALVTGGAGFIGSHIVDRLVQRGWKVCVVDNLSTGKKEFVHPEALFSHLDIKSPEVSGIFEKEKPEVVFHYAAQINVRKSMENPFHDAQDNIIGSLNILQNAMKHGVGKIVFASSGGALYGEADTRPTPESSHVGFLSPYAIAKRAVEHYLEYFSKFHGMNFVSLRLSNVYGPRQNPLGEAGVIAIFSDLMLQGKQPVMYGTGEQTRDFVYVDDVIEANLLALSPNIQGIYNIGTGTETSVCKIFRLLKTLTGFSGDALQGDAKSGEPMRICLDFQKAKKELGWDVQTSLEQGLQKTVQWYQRKIGL